MSQGFRTYRVRIRVRDTLNGDKLYVNPYVNNHNTNPNVKLLLSQSLLLPKVPQSFSNH